MTPAHPHYDDLLAALRQHAALSGPFRPVEALREAAAGAGFDMGLLDDQVLVAELLSAVQPDCMIEAGPEGAHWIMRPAARHELLDAGAARPETLAEAAADPALAQALAGQGGFAPAAIDDLVAKTPAPERLEQAIVTLERAGPAAPAHDRLAALRGALNAARQVQRNEDMLAAGFFGREAELAQIARWIAEATPHPPLRMLHLSGLPGIGKSFLLERAIQSARLEHAPVIVRLDFDRAAQQMIEPHPLFEEISRQIADGLPHLAAELRALRLESAGDLAAMSAAMRRRALPYRLIGAMTEGLAQSGRVLLLMLDTLDALRCRGETHLMTLFEQLERLQKDHGAPVCVISAGSGDTLDPVPERLGPHLVLGGLDHAAGRRLLAARRVHHKLWPRILKLARGNPLLMLLAAEAAHGGWSEPDDLPADLSDAEMGGALFRAILERVPDPLQRVAAEGLVLRQITSDTLTEVLAPALGLALDAGGAGVMLDALAREEWLVTREGDGLRHRPDLRRMFLEQVYRDHPVSAAEINRRAADWFARRDPVEALYHRLQLTRSGAALPEVPSTLAQGFSDAMRDDLPEPAHDAVRQAMGLRSNFGRMGADLPARRLPADEPGRDKSDPHWLWRDPQSGRLVLRRLPAETTYPAPDPRALRDLELMLAAGATREAGFVLAQGLRSPVRADGHAGLLALAHHWQTGRWSVVRRLVDALSADDLEAGMAQSPNLMGRVLLEAWAEFRFDALVERFDAPEVLDQAMAILRQSGRIGLSGGALEFACLAAKAGASDAPELGAAVAVLHPHLRDAPLEAASPAHARADRLRRRLGLVLPPPATAQASVLWYAQSLAPLNPYADALQARLQEFATAGEGAVLQALHGLNPELPRLAAALLPTIEGAAGLADSVHPDPLDTAEALALMGLGAEWADGYALHHPLPDIPTLARAAERWRLASNGLWRYGARRPRAWASERAGADPTSLERARRIAEYPYPEATARALIWRWADPARATGRQAERRLARPYDAARKAAKDAPDPIAAALGALQDAGVTGVIATPLSVLAARNVAPATALRPPDPPPSSKETPR